MPDIFSVFINGSALEIIAQILGVFALATSVISFQMKTYRQIMVMQIICAALFSVHLGMLYAAGHRDAISGCVGNGICFVRDIVFWMTDRRVEKRRWLKTLVFSVLMVIAGIVTWQSPVSLICTVGMVLKTVSFSMYDPQNVRRVILIASPFFLVYEILSASIGGTVNEIISFTSAVIALFRYRKKKAKTEKA